MRLISYILNHKNSYLYFLLFHFVIWLSVGLYMDVHPDMADHWVWSRYLNFGFYEHPPMVAITMKFADLFGNSPIFGLKIGAIIFSTVILYLCFLLAKETFNTRTATIFLLILEANPYFSIGSVFWHIDQPYMFFWLLGLLVIIKYIKSNNINWIFAFGIIAGLGALSKYIMILFPLGLAVWCGMNRKPRELLTSWKTYAAALTAIVLILPNLYWNYTHEWATFTYNFKKGLTGATFGLQFLFFTIAQLVLFSIVFTSKLWIEIFKKRLTYTNLKMVKVEHSFLMIMGLVPLLFFSISSLRGAGSDPHWVNVGYFSLFLLLARWFDLQVENGKIKGFSLITGFAYIFNFTLIFATVLQVHYKLIELPYKSSPLFKVVGWEQTAEKIEKAFKDHRIEFPKYAVTREYQLGGALSLYLSTHPASHSIEKEIRNDWSPVEKVAERGAAVVCPVHECEKFIKEVKKRYENSILFLDKIDIVHNGFSVRSLNIYHMPGLNQKQ